MRTSRPMKRPPRPLLDVHSSSGKGKAKGKGKASRQQEQDSSAAAAAAAKTTTTTARNGSKNGVYSYDDDHGRKGRGMKRAEQRLKGAKEDVSQSFAAGTSQSAKSKGKRRARDGDANADEDGDDNGGDASDDNAGYDDAFGAEGMQDYRNIKFKIGLDSDAEDGDQAGFGDDDEEIDSDMADTEGDSESDDDDEDGVGGKAGSSSKKSKSQKKSQKRKVASDFYSGSEGNEDDHDDEDADADSINLNEDDDDNDDESDGGDGFIDLSEVLAKRVQKEKAAEARALGKSIPAPEAKKPKSNSHKADEVDLRRFKPGSLNAKGASLEGSESGEEEEEEEDDEDAEESDIESEEEEIDDDDDDDLEEDDDDALGKLGSVIERLSGKRTADSQDGSNKLELDERELLKKRRRLMQASERNEAVPEGEYAAPPSTGASSSKLTLDSLLSALAPEQANELRQSLKPLIAATRRKDTTVEDANSAIEAELFRLTADEKALLARERKKERSNPLKAPGALPAPLAPLHQAKIERQAAREKQADKILEWNETVKYMKGVNREGEDDPESRLDLKALNDSQGKGKGLTSAELVAKFTPANAMEKQINDLIASTGATQRDLLTTESTALMEALPTKSTEAAEAQDRARIAQLRLARELMFRAERKAKRVAKIKSRTFRKIAKKSRQRQALKDGDASLTLDEMMELDAFDGGSRAEAERERLETVRARERATLRHASGASSAAAGGRWSRGIKGMEGMDDDMMQALRTRESKQELLRRKVLGQDSDDGSDDSDVSEGDAGEGDNNDVENLKTQALDAMERIQTDDADNKGLSKGVMGMKFMQRAAKRDQDRVDGMIEDFRMQVEGESDDEEYVADDDKKSKAAKGGDLIQENPGRMIFGPSAGRSQPSKGEDLANGQTLSQRAKKRLNSTKTTGSVSVTSSGGNNVQAATGPSGSLSASSTATLLDYNPFAALTTGNGIGTNGKTPVPDANPWLSGDAEDGRVRLSSKKNNQTVGKDSAGADKAASKLQKTQGRSKEAMQKAHTDATVDIDVEHVLSNTAKVSTPSRLAAPATSSPAVATSPAEQGSRKLRETAPPPSSAQASRTNGQRRSSSDDEDSDNDSDVLPEAVRQHQGPTAFKQRDLVARAFAGDNVVTDFIEMKKAEIEADAPKDEDLTLPGWGAWGGKGARKSQKQQQKKKIKHIPGIDASDRKDAKFDHVIISEKSDRKAAKYLTKDLPYPYTSVRQFEQKLAQPMGVEWNTRGSVKETTTPRVLTKPGMVIKPVTRKV